MRQTAMRYSTKVDHSSEFAPFAKDERTTIKELQALRNLPMSQRGHAAAWAIRIENAKSHRIRNYAASALADLGAHNASNVMINLLGQPDKNGSRGALLLAVGRLKARVPLSILVDIIVDGAVEGKEEALDLINHRSYRECSPAEFAASCAKIEAARISARGEQSRVLQRTFENLRIKHQSGAFAEIKDLKRKLGY